VRDLATAAIRAMVAPHPVIGEQAPATVLQDLATGAIPAMDLLDLAMGAIPAMVIPATAATQAMVILVLVIRAMAATGRAGSYRPCLARLCLAIQPWAACLITRPSIRVLA